MKKPTETMQLESYEAAIVTAIREIDKRDRERVSIALAESIISFTVGAKAGQAACKALQEYKP